ncbi:hypothetical protein ACJIZ3_014176 [Penstemon smallii]|uniref:Uncharacterized protein n=1 Tax=Penstemon smallii TaxID=265156 RepID=A0ABD3RJ58_9LAMI
MVMEVVHEDMGEGTMQCINHPYKNSTPGGICAFCLQEKLGKLVSSSFPLPVFPSSSSSSSSPSFRSDFSGSTTTTSAAAALQIRHLASSSSSQSGNNDCKYHGTYYTKRSKLPFVLTHKQKKKKDGVVPMGTTHDSTNIVFKRSKSTTTPRRKGMHFLDEHSSDDYSPHHKRRFWSFLYLSKHSSTVKKNDAPTNKHYKDLNFTPTTPTTACNNTVGPSSLKKREDFVVVEENGSPNEATFDRKVSRSRSVGCGSRSFSGDFFERISTGFGDCTLRRVESQREGKPKVQSIQRNNGSSNGQDCIKERVRCGGIFSGFIITSSSSSSSSSSYWVSTTAEDSNVNGKSLSATHGRSKSWGWALASPMRAFSKPSSFKRDTNNSSKNSTPNLDAIPSLLAVSG